MFYWYQIKSSVDICKENLNDVFGRYFYSKKIVTWL